MSFCRTLPIALGLLVSSTACGGSSPSVPSDPPDELGPFGVGYVAFEAVDADRGRRGLPIDLWYPVDPEDAEAVQDEPRTAYPLLGPAIALESEIAVDDPPVSARAEQKLLVFSHGYGGISKQSIGLMEALASHGFVVAAPEHTGNSQFSNGDSFDEAAANRVPDVSFVIDTMMARSADPEDSFFGRLDPTQVGVIGHSFGGMTAIGSVAGWAGAAGDPRVAAIVPISAVIDGDMQSDSRTGPNAGFTAAALARIDVPVLLVGGTEDINVPVGNNAIAFAQILNSPRVIQLDIAGATHTHFANVCDLAELLIGIGFEQAQWPTLGAEGLIEPYETTCTPDAFPIEEATRLQGLYSVAFFRRYLLGETGYDRYLSTEFAESESAATVFVK
ncbi:MAG: hypothetical protein WBG86_14975 [Polyangiales bacterium]